MRGRHRAPQDCSKEMIVSKVLQSDTIECTYFDGEQQFTSRMQAGDVIKLDVLRNNDLPVPDYMRGFRLLAGLAHGAGAKALCKPGPPPS